jgi:hypothetical protein
MLTQSSQGDDTGSLSHALLRIEVMFATPTFPPNNSLGVRMISMGGCFPETLIRLHYKLHALQERKRHLLYSPCSLTVNTDWAKIKNTGNVRITVTLSRVRVTNAVVENQ